MKVLKIFTIAALAVTLAACCSCRTRTKGAGSLTTNGWQLMQIEGEPFAAAGEKYTLQFGSDGKFSGMGDCNRIMGGYTSAPSGTLSFEGAASTRMFCSDQQSEDRFLSVLNSVDGYRVDGNTLLLLSGGQTVLVLKKV
ncbi:MAG: META domain-containing protein [Rikenellaceae bacterium]|nr:META domain-containing protein [Rikenellaceae bacterium]